MSGLGTRARSAVASGCSRRQQRKGQQQHAGLGNSPAEDRAEEELIHFSCLNVTELTIEDCGNSSNRFLRRPPASAEMAASNSLPLEILDQILKAMGTRQGDRQDVLSTSLVARAWREPSQRLLVSTCGQSQGAEADLPGYVDALKRLDPPPTLSIVSGSTSLLAELLPHVGRIDAFKNRYGEETAPEERAAVLELIRRGRCHLASRIPER